jgi:hypothetical protein
MKVIRCPHCLYDHRPDGLEFKRDNDLNILCGSCGNVLFGVTEEADETVARLYRKPVQSHTYNPGVPHHHPAAHAHGPYQPGTQGVCG